MGFWSGLWNGIKSIANSISMVLKESPLVRSLVTTLAAALPPPFDVVAVIAVEALAASAGVQEKPEELGFQMNEADKKPEDFGSFKEYKEYLDREYPFDQEKFDKLSDEQKAACRYVGMAGTIQEVQEAKNLELNPEALGVLVKGIAGFKWSDQQINAFAHGLGTSLSSSGNASFEDIGALAKGSLNPDKWDSVEGAISAGAKEAGVKQDNAAIIASLQENV